MGQALILLISNGMVFHRSDPPQEKVQSTRVGVLRGLGTVRLRQEDDLSVVRPSVLLVVGVRDSGLAGDDAAADLLSCFIKMAGVFIFLV